MVRSGLIASVAVLAAGVCLPSRAMRDEGAGRFRVSRAVGGAIISGNPVQVPQSPFAVAAWSHFLYVADARHNVIRKIDLLTDRETIAVGAGSTKIVSGQPASDVSLFAPSGVATDEHGDLFISDSGNQRILVVPVASRRLFGRQMAAGHVYQIAGARKSGRGVALENPWGITCDERGDAIFVDANTGQLWLIADQTGQVLGRKVRAGGSYRLSLSTNLEFPRSVAALPAGLAIADSFDNRILMVAGRNETAFGRRMRSGATYTLIDSRTSSLLKSFGSPQGVAAGSNGSLVFSDGIGDIYLLTTHAGVYYGRHLTAGVSRLVDRGGGIVPGLIGGLAVDSESNLFIAGQLADIVAVLPESTMRIGHESVLPGALTRIAGNGSVNFGGEGALATMSDLSGPMGLAALPGGGVVIADEGNNRVRVVAGSTMHAYGRTLKTHHIYTILGDGETRPPATGSFGASTSIGEPDAVAVDVRGDVFALSALSSQLFVVAARAGRFLGRAIEPGHVYLVAGNGSTGFGGDGTRAGLARFSGVASVAVSAQGIAIADSGNGRIRYVALESGVQFGLRMVSGDIYTIAGNGGQPTAAASSVPATHAFLGDPQGVAFDRSGDLVIANTGDNVVQLLASRSGRLLGHAVRSGFLYTLAGNGSAGYSGNGLAALKSAFFLPTAIAVDGFGNILLADSGNNRLRVVAESLGHFYGLEMTRGDVYTVAGSGSIGACESPFPTKTDLMDPSGVTSSSISAVWISNTGANEVCLLEGSPGVT
jgi:hypothetical protein